jgi:hypothetical protein
VRSPLTAFVIVGVLGVALVAAVDTLSRGDGDAADRGESVLGTEEAAAALQTAGVRGVITYSDQSCRLHSVRLPDLTSLPAPTIRSCEPHIPTGGIGTWKGDVVWAGFGYRVVQVVLPQKVLTKAIRQHPAGRLPLPGQPARGYRAAQAVALGRGSYAVLVDAPRSSPLLAVFEGERLIFLLPPTWVGQRDRLRASPLGNYFAVLSMRPRTFRVFTKEGNLVPLPDVDNPKAIAWSPDERWTALANSSSLHIFASDEPRDVINIPLAVRDLDWDA